MSVSMTYLYSANSQRSNLRCWHMSDWLEMIDKREKVRFKTGFKSSKTVLLYAAETWSLLSTSSRALEAFHYEVSKATAANQMASVHPEWRHLRDNLPSISDTISHRRNALFGHGARLPDDVPAHKALNCHINLWLGRSPSSQWLRRPGRPRSRWVDQLRTDNNLPPADLWRRAVNRGHRGVRYSPCRLSNNNNKEWICRGREFHLLGEHTQKLERQKKI